MAEPPPHNLTGVVIITLPPPDNPSLGKTITAYTISDEDPPPPPSQLPNSSQNPHPQAHPSPITRSLLYRTRRALLPIVCISLIALFAWASVSSQRASFILRDPIGNGIEEDGNRRERNKSESTFVFPLYKRGFKYGNLVEGEGEVKLGKFVGFDLSKRRRGKVTGVGRGVSAGLKVDQTSVVPVRGEAYPDGLYYTYMHFGNPPRPYFLDMDTGSDLTWLQCDAPCTSCAKSQKMHLQGVNLNLGTPISTILFSDLTSVTGN